MGRIVTWFWIIIFLISPVVAQNIPRISFTNTGETMTLLIHPNEMREIPIYLLKVTNLSYADIILKFDSTILYPERILSGDFNINYDIIEDNKIVLILNLSKGFSGDLLLTKITFRVIGEIGESSYLNLVVNELRNTEDKNMFYTISRGIVHIVREIDPTIQDLLKAENKTEFAEENNLIIEDGKIKIKITTDTGEKDIFIDPNELENLTKNQSLKKIELYRKFNWEDYLIPILLVAVIIILILTYKELR